MKKTLTILAATAASFLALSAGAASAQSWGAERPAHVDARYDQRGDARYDQRGDARYDQRGDRGWMNINQRQEQLDRRIDRGVRNGSITRGEAYRLRNEFQTIARLEHRYRANGLSGWERADLDRRFDRLSAQIRWERNDGDRYGSGYGNDYRR
ncbi:hypothetical protein [Phenylobacterium sp. Root700]|uniref:hypothetical protein n=1 Tax=Phenylobacterium sp. Root700 TaxID=1736591 RepID=UPI0006FBC356|nr:hypothetical protein [Phenylobacterium sp. Root700]KRB40667.1 hypothetical protein ASE02_08205 [Phenylobacterium sp. Root700]